MRATSGNIVDLRQLKITVTDQGDFFVLDFNRRRSAFEVKTRGDFLGHARAGGDLPSRFRDAPFLTSTTSASHTVSKEGMANHTEFRVRQF